MSKQDSLKKVEQVQKVSLPAILAGQMFYLIENEKRSVNGSSVADFDAWATSFVEEITNVDRAVWDVFARWRFINFLLAEDVLEMKREASGTILLIETEEKTSAGNSDETASQANGA